jgi:hypothetical protein
MPAPAGIERNRRALILAPALAGVTNARRYAAAGDKLVRRDRERQSREIRRIRRKLGQPSSICSGCWTRIRNC